MAGARIIVGLGNPGSEYAASRHNMGHAVVERLAQTLGGRFGRRGPAYVAEVPHQDPPLYLAKLRSYMNVSGPEVARLLTTLGLDASALILVYDDLDLPFGKIRARRAGRHGGHNGMRSVIAALGTDAVRRVKVGIGRPASRDPDTVADWVLTPFDPDERAALPAIVDEAAEAALALATSAGPPRDEEPEGAA